MFLNLQQLYGVQKDKLWKYRHALRSVFALAGGNLLSAVLGAVGGLLVARYMGPRETGLYRSFTIPLMYLTFLHLGTFDGLHRQIPFYIGKERSDEVEKIASASGAWNILVASMVSLLFIVLAARSLVRNDILAVFGWLAQITVCWGTFYGGYLGATYRTINHFVMLAKIQLIQSITVFALVFSIPILGFYGLCLRAAIPALLSIWLFHYFRPLKAPLKLDLKSLQDVIKIGMPLCFWGTLETSLWVALENTMLLKFDGVKALGLFGIAVVMREGLAVITRAVHQVLMPRMVEAYARQGLLRSITQKSMSISLVLVLLMLIVVISISFCLQFLVPYLIPKYVDGINIMRVCMLAVVVEAAALPLNALFATGKSWLYGRGVLVGLISFVAFSMFFSSILGGMMAVVLGSLVGRFVRLVICYIDLFIKVRSEAQLV